MARCWVLRDRARRSSAAAVVVVVGGCRFCFFWLVGPADLSAGAGGVVGCRLYVENFTVDASIFVAKFLRALGGCLGTRNRRRT